MPHCRNRGRRIGGKGGRSVQHSRSMIFTSSPNVLVQNKRIVARMPRRSQQSCFVFHSSSRHLAALSPRTAKRIARRRTAAHDGHRQRSVSTTIPTSGTPTQDRRNASAITERSRTAPNQPFRERSQRALRQSDGIVASDGHLRHGTGPTYDARQHAPQWSALAFGVVLDLPP